MLLPRPLKKMIAVFRGGLSPQIITLSIALGFTFGLIPGWSGVHTFIVLVFVLMNVHTGLFLLSAGLGKSLCLAAAPVLYHLGGGVQDYLQWVLIFLGNIPIIGLTDFSRYAVCGALIAGPVIGVIAGLLFAKLVLKFRSAWVKLEEGSEAYQKWNSKKWVRIIDRILVGKKTKDVRAVIESKSPMFRKAGLVLVGIPLLLMLGVGLFGQGSMLGNYAAETLEKVNGAEVNIASLGISPLSGSLTVSDVQVTDPAKPKLNQIAIEKFAADVGVFNLLRGKVVIEDVTVKNLTFNTPREKAGEVFKSEKSAEETEKFDPSSVDIDAADIAKMQKYFKNAQKLKETLAKIRRFLPSGKKDAGEKNTVPESYLGYLKAKAPVASVAKFIVKNISLEKVALPSEQFGLSNIKITNLSDAPLAFGKPVGIEVTSVDSDKALDMEIDFEPDGTGKITGTFANFDLAIFQSQMSDDNGMLFDKGTANGKFGGTISKDFIDITIDLNLKDLQAKSSGKGLFGLDAKMTSQVFGVMDNLQTQLRIVGPMTGLSVAFDVKGLGEQFKGALADAGMKLAEDEGKKLIKKVLDDEDLGGKIPKEIKDIIGDPKDIIDGIGGLFDRKKKKK
ncbi:MAG: hypothetical protein FVQ82_05135 [Planctomycetes bacterium]|nr:hypothetical protein [Planctomycetota bacterium]